MTRDITLRSLLRLGSKETGLGSTGVWRYCPADIAGVVEFGFWNGVGSHDLRPHFHNEMQIAIILTGSRAFRVNDRVVTVAAGQGISFPAGLLHTPLATPDSESICLNIYLEDERVASSYHIFNAHDIPLGADTISLEDVLRLTNDASSCGSQRSIGDGNSIKLRAALINSDRRIGDIAADFDRSREGFSRQVTRELGLAPHSFRLLSRLNHARQLLREGQPIAAVAADAGFSDQSHMTRLFRRTFGTTPGLYWRT
ncbi:AraC family transcriptional regulator [Pseudomonas aeruginosa]|uniref:AraC family transcriptional regulator n=1 Tax=Pseudomonas aeruginosa TaxID=287 RepID=UPI0028FF76DB|nr:AraC family transcriptional regulator [Pseudomonas aeruginosa]MDU0704111.1 AraC family transcriptional regulator [Pseudomonas aeruginosa]